MDANNTTVISGLPTTNSNINPPDSQVMGRERNSSTSTIPSQSSHDNLAEPKMNLSATMNNLTNQVENSSKPRSDSSQSLSDAVHKLQL